MMRSEYPGVIRGHRGHGSGVKKSKPAMEKRRRARINASLAELRSLIPETVKRGNRRYSKMEKADILEMAVQYLRHLQDANKEKSHVTTASYSLGFTECTQEVTDFFRSSSPTTSRFKGSLLQHLNGCGASNVPDSPSSSPKKTASKSISGIVTPTSIIARCLLSSTTQITPRKLSNNSRNSNTPAAVSSTSDDGSSESKFCVEVGTSDDDLNSSTESSTRDPKETPQARISEVFKVKKDLISAFSNECCPCQPRRCSLNNDNIGCLSLDRSCSNNKDSDNSSATESNYAVETFVKTHSTGRNEEVLQKNIQYSEETIPTIVGHANVPIPFSETTLPLTVIESVNIQEDPLDTSNCYQKTSQTSCTDTSPRVNKNITSSDVCQKSLPPTDPNNNNKPDINSSVVVLSPQQNNSATIENSQTSLIAQEKMSGSSLFPSFNVSVRPDSDNNDCTKYNLTSLPTPRHSPQEHSEITLSVKEDASQTKPSNALDATSDCGEQLGNITDDATCSFEDMTTRNVTAGNSAIKNCCTPSYLIPVYVQTSCPGELPAFQKAMIIKSPPLTNISNIVQPVKTLQAIASKVKDESGDTCLPTKEAHGDPFSSDSLVCSNLVLETVNISRSQTRVASPKSMSENILNDSENENKLAELNKVIDCTTTLNITSKTERTPLVGQYIYVKAKTQEVEENINSPKTIRPVVLDARQTNASLASVVTDADSGSCASYLHKRRLFSENDKLLNIMSDPGSRDQFDTCSDSAKKMRFTSTSVHNSTLYQKAGPRISNVNQYISTKFRPIAPKPEDINVSTTNANHEQNCTQRPPTQTQLSTTDFYKSNSSQSQNLNPSIRQNSCEDHHSLTSCRSSTTLQISPDSGSIQMCNMKESPRSCVKADDILTTVLKSTIPLNKTQFAARHWKVPTKKQTGIFPEQESSNNFKFQQENSFRLIKAAPSENIPCQMYTNEKPVASELPSTVLLDNQPRLHETSQSILEIRKVFLDSASRHNTENTSNNMLHDYSQHCIQARTTPVTNTCNAFNFMTGENRSSYSERNSAVPPVTSSRIYEYSEQEREWGRFTDTNIEIKSRDGLCLPCDTEVVEKSLLHAMTPDYLRYVASSAHKDKNVKISSVCDITSNAKQFDMGIYPSTSPKETRNTDPLPNFARSASSQPLNLSLRDSNPHLTRPTLPDTETVIRKCSPAEQCLSQELTRPDCLPVDMSVKAARQFQEHTHFRKTGTCTSKLFDPCGCSYHISSTPARNHGQTSTSHCVVNTDPHQETTQATFPRKEVSYLINKERTSGIDTPNENISLQLSLDTTYSKNVSRESDMLNSRENMIHVLPTWIQDNGLSLITHHAPQTESLDFSFRSNITKSSSGLTSMVQQAVNVSDDLQTADDDVWRPW